MSRHVPPDGDPLARCGECGRSYNPYRYGLNCPDCDPRPHLGCDDCGYTWLEDAGHPNVDCPRCDADSRYVAEL